MSHLQDAIDLVEADQSDNGTVGLFEARALVVEAARKWKAHTCQSDLFNDAAPDDPRLTTLDTSWLD